MVMKQEPPISRLVTPLDKSKEIAGQNQRPPLLALCAMGKKRNRPSFYLVS
jgi:hypothetical protein